MIASRDTKLATSAANDGFADAREKPAVDRLATAPRNAARRDVDEHVCDDKDVEKVACTAVAEAHTPRR
jgi:hypothetical protein